MQHLEEEFKNEIWKTVRHAKFREEQEKAVKERKKNPYQE